MTRTAEATRGGDAALHHEREGDRERHFDIKGGCALHPEGHPRRVLGQQYGFEAMSITDEGVQVVKTLDLGYGEAALQHSAVAKLVVGIDAEGHHFAEIIGCSKGKDLARCEAPRFSGEGSHMNPSELVPEIFDTLHRVRADYREHGEPFPDLSDQRQTTVPKL